MTINWYRPSQCVLILVTISSILVFLGCLGCGFVLHFAPEEPSEDINGGIYMTVPTIALLSAAVVTVLALVIGCCGACKDSKILLIVFAVLSLVVAGILVGSTSSVFAFTMKGTIENKLHGVMLDDLKNYTNTSTQPNIYHTIQQDLKCCGVDSHTDWNNSKWKNDQPGNAVAPESCCEKNNTESSCNTDHNNLYSKGCLEVVLSRLKMVVYGVFGLSLALALLQVLSAMFACYGAILIRRYQSYDIL